ncbi:6-carboxytetrahydropterin synthase QueD [Desulfoglaeba alkanexedens]|uniref:6-carboxy-5,6,7,8-tetrahydropterin synthase n=1 Tax=Desulfoglaeba alkanexedens ALDC TaxID=980445 RepID=A0A4P8L3I7_9BACT|nr:6-carboxytetrahydropterin synthase QueD [Desulfoglaeba alkanexedens]QCQ22420.1 6-carboxytetrahydropterin synthase QueD [Desulfoglaeba alkanexedens ALDC]
MPACFEVYVETHFSAAHRLKGYPGDCARLHGHNWMVEVTVRCTQLDALGIGIDFRDVRTALKEAVADLDHQDLGEIPAFRAQNPTSENIARYLYRELSSKLDDASRRVSKVKVCETPGAGALYWEE